MQHVIRSVLNKKLRSQKQKSKSHFSLSKRLATILVLPLFVVGLFVVSSAARATTVTPTLVAGNPSCTSLGYPFGFKPNTPSEGNPVGVHSVAGGTITITKSGESISWTSTIGIDAVIIKGGPNANLYVYDPPAESFGDTTLVAPTNPSNGNPYGFSHVEFCYDFNLGVSKTANTTFTRDFDWTIAKSVDQTDLDLSPGQQHDVNYSVVVDKDAGTDSGWSVSGTIGVTNPHPTQAAEGVVVTDSISGIGNVAVTCPSTTIAALGTMECTYGPVALPDATSRVNTATATTTTVNIEDGTGTANVVFGAPTTVTDDCVAVFDSLQGVLGASVCADQTFNYTRTIFADNLVCGDNTINNIASLATDDGLTRTSNATVNVNVACVLGCTLTQGYWKTHASGKKFDTAWNNITGGPNATFYASGKTWLQVFNTPPAGNPYYQLAHQYMAAKLNVLNGATPTTAVSNALASAEALFAGLNPNSGFTKAQKANMVSLAGTLGSFNQGITGPGHCSE